MRSPVLFSLFLLIFFGCRLPSHAQDFYFGATLSPSISHGKMKKDAGTLILPSLGIDILYQIPETPIFIGSALSYGQYGTKLTIDHEIIDGVEQSWRIRRNNNLVTLSGIVRVMPALPGIVRPFIEGQLGGLHTYTRSKVREDRFSEPYSEGTEFYDWAEFWQFGAGMVLTPESWGRLSLELRMDYLHSAITEYLTSKDTSYDSEGAYFFHPRRSPFELLRPGIAVRILLD
ncbi:hypothetical protein IFO69_13815 [Echinicola sp. CAU 1574]|uniref:Outer membrane protein beta-barrel domain-containing protein n=1 Tax=Echinicola arenosa TaxID=2774144 RepID=A0ABR9APJ4_9BACT|nr:hypothetical protein [Echinicola arenosa]MBD8489830.1 hypothetical protein [Echinicola arenosa]